jgi:hypothetical protein
MIPECKFKIGDHVSHRPDLYDMTESKVREISRGFRTGDGVQWDERNLGSIRKELNARVEKVDGEDCLIFDEHIGIRHNSIWNEEKGRFCVVAVTSKIPKKVHPFYGWIVITLNEEMSTIYPERALTKI